MKESYVEGKQIQKHLATLISPAECARAATIEIYSYRFNYVYRTEQKSGARAVANEIKPKFVIVGRKSKQFIHQSS